MPFKKPAEIAEAAAVAGEIKCDTNWFKLILLGFLAGAYIAFGAMLAVTVVGGFPKELIGLKKFFFAAVFPVGLMLVVIAGSELFTGNCMFPLMCCLKGTRGWLGMLKNWLWSYLGNFIGSVFVAFCLAFITGLFIKDPWMTEIGNIAKVKCSLTWWEAFWRAVGCNWLVCLAVWISISSEDIVGKIWAIWFPIMAFVALGFEHSVANMFFIPAGIFCAGTVTWGQFIFNNLIPVTLGNIVGGSIMVGFIYHYIYAPKSCIGKENK